MMIQRIFANWTDRRGPGPDARLRRPTRSCRTRRDRSISLDNHEARANTELPARTSGRRHSRPLRHLVELAKSGRRKSLGSDTPTGWRGPVNRCPSEYAPRTYPAAPRPDRLRSVRSAAPPTRPGGPVERSAAEARVAVGRGGPPGENLLQIHRHHLVAPRQDVRRLDPPPRPSSGHGVHKRHYALPHHDIDRGGRILGPGTSPYTDVPGSSIIHIDATGTRRTARVVEAEHRLHPGRAGRPTGRSVRSHCRHRPLPLGHRYSPYEWESTTTGPSQGAASNLAADHRGVVVHAGGGRMLA